MSRIKKYNKEALEPVVKESKSIAHILEYFSLQKTGSNYSNMKLRITEAGLDVSHFTGQSWNKGRKDLPKKSASDILVLREQSDPITKGPFLKKCLIGTGRSYLCEICGLPPFWNGKTLVLQVDHINGHRWDNREDNLRFVCPNCHTQTETHSRSNRNGI